MYYFSASAASGNIQVFEKQNVFSCGLNYLKWISKYFNYHNKPCIKKV